MYLKQRSREMLFLPSFVLNGPHQYSQWCPSRQRKRVCTHGRTHLPPTPPAKPYPAHPRAIRTALLPAWWGSAQGRFVQSQAVREPHRLRNHILPPRPNSNSLHSHELGRHGSNVSHGHHWRLLFHWGAGDDHRWSLRMGWSVSFFII